MVVTTGGLLAVKRWGSDVAVHPTAPRIPPQRVTSPKSAVLGVAVTLKLGLFSLQRAQAADLLLFWRSRWSWSGPHMWDVGPQREEPLCPQPTHPAPAPDSSWAQ